MLEISWSDEEVVARIRSGNRDRFLDAKPNADAPTSGLPTDQTSPPWPWGDTNHLLKELPAGRVTRRWELSHRPRWSPWRRTISPSKQCAWRGFGFSRRRGGGVGRRSRRQTGGTRIGGRRTDENLSRWHARWNAKPRWYQKAPVFTIFTLFLRLAWTSWQHSHTQDTLQLLYVAGSTRRGVYRRRTIYLDQLPTNSVFSRLTPSAQGVRRLSFLHSRSGDIPHVQKTV
jgi:hypothetical protein